MLSSRIHSIGHSPSTSDGASPNDITRNNNVPSSKLTRHGGVYTISKPKFSKRSGETDYAWWADEFRCMKLSRVVIKEHKSWDEWLKRYKTEWEKAMITPEEGKSLSPFSGRFARRREVSRDARVT